MKEMNGVIHSGLLALVAFASVGAMSAHAEDMPAAPLQPGVEELAAGTSAAPAAPEAAGEVSPWSFNLTLASQYVTRGFNNSKGNPVVQGGVDFVHSSGFNAGFWMSTLSDKFVQGSWAETDFYAGYTKSFGDINIGAQIYYYIYPNGKFVYDGSVRGQSYNYGELVPTFNYKWFTAKYWYTYTKDYFGVNDTSMFTTGRGHSRGSGYLDLNGNFDLGKGYALQVHYGYQNVRNFEKINWSDAKIGLTKSFDGGWLAAVAATKAWSDTTDNIYGAGYTYDWKKYNATSKDEFNPIAGTVTFSLTRYF